MAVRNLVVVGASAGGVEALTSLFHHLPADLQAAFLVVLHVPTTGKSILPDILNRISPMHASHAENGEEIQPGRIYVAPSNYHLMIGHGKTLLSLGPRVNGVRPSIDILFHTAAEARNYKVIGVILSGTMMDGAMGLQDISAAGGVTIVQNPDEAIFPGLPLHSIQNVRIDYVESIEGIANTIVRLVSEPVEQSEKQVTGTNMQDGNEILQEDHRHFVADDHTSPRTLLTCPECGGVLWELNRKGITRYQCQVGHVFSQESLVDEQDGAVEYALWAAVRILEEKASLAKRLANRAEERSMKRSMQGFLQTAADSEAKAGVIRALLMKENGKVLSLPDTFDVANAPEGEEET